MQKETSDCRIVNFAKILILFSFVLLLVGGVSSYKEYRKRVSHTNQEIILSDSNVISVDNINSDNSNINSSSNDVSDENTFVSDYSDSNSDSVVVSDTNVVSENNLNQSNLSENRNVSIDDVNLYLKTEIERTYGVSVIYGADTDGYSVKYLDQNVDTVSIQDSYLVNSSLVKLKNVLELYPSNLFFEIKSGGLPLTIMLVNNFSDKLITGVTDSSYANAVIVIAVAYPFEETFYHESYHYIERFLFKRGANFSSWNSFNPSDFSYGTIYKNISYANSFSENAYFVNTYAQTDEKEDRASTFEYMMANTKASCLNNGNPIWKKAVFMSRMIEAVLDSASPNNIEYWERFLY